MGGNFCLGRNDALLIQGRKFAQAVLEFRPSVNSVAYLSLCILGNIVAGGFAGVSAVTEV